MGEDKAIPLKKITVVQIIKSHYRGIKIKIRGIDFIGSEHFFFREEAAPENFIKRVKSLERIIETEGRTFEKYMDPDNYKCSDANVEHESFDKNTIVLKTEIGKIAVNYSYYSYFKKLGVTLRFCSKVDPIGMFKEDEFMGILLPIRIREEKSC